MTLAALGCNECLTSPSSLLFLKLILLLLGYLNILLPIQYQCHCDHLLAVEAERVLHIPRSLVAIVMNPELLRGRAVHYPQGLLAELQGATDDTEVKAGAGVVVAAMPAAEAQVPPEAQR